MTPLFKKLNLGDIDTIVVLNPPQSMESELEQLVGVRVQRKATSRPTAFAIGFAVTQQELVKVSAKLAQATAGDAIVWVAYPKKSSKRYAREFNRDSGDWSVLGAAGFEPVRQVAIDDDWSALRFRRTEFIQSLTRKNASAISAAGKRRTERPSNES